MRKPKDNVSRMGHDFEERVKDVLAKNNYVLVEKNKWTPNYAPENDYATKREFDLVMYNNLEKQFYVVECKAHISEEKMVEYEQVRKFDYVSRHYGASRAKKMIVTDTGLSSRAMEYCQRNFIRVIDGKRLREMERRPGTPYLPAVSSLVRYGLEKIVKGLILNYKKS